MSEHVSSDEPYLLVEEVAERLGLPLAVLLRRVEAGDVPSRRLERDDGYHYALRLSDLGIETDDSSAEDSDADAETADEPGGIGVFDQQETHHTEEAIASAFNAGPEPADDPPSTVADASAETAVTAVGDAPAEAAGEAAAPSPPQEEAAWGHTAPDSGQRWHGLEEVVESGRSWTPQADAQPAWSIRPLEPRQPPPWLVPEAAPESPAEELESDVSEADLPESPPPATEEAGAAAEAAAAPSTAEATAVEAADAEASAKEADIAEESHEPEPSPEPAATTQGDAAPSPAAVETHASATRPAGTPTFEGPERRRDPTRGLLDAAMRGSGGDMALMSLDARDLVAGLLDRWERTLEQRIYTEQRQRFQAELSARQSMVKQLQMELQAVRAEHAAAQAEKDRLLAEKERELADRERDLAEVRRYAVDTDRLIAPPPPPRRARRWFRGRDEPD